MMANQGRSRPSRLEDALALDGGSGGFANPEWLASIMGYPPGWLIPLTDESETASTRTLPSGSATG